MIDKFSVYLLFGGVWKGMEWRLLVTTERGIQQHAAFVYESLGYTSPDGKQIYFSAYDTP